LSPGCRPDPSRISSSRKCKGYGSILPHARAMLVAELVVRAEFERFRFETQEYMRWRSVFHPSFYRGRKVAEFSPEKTRVLEWYIFLNCAGLTGHLYFEPERGLWGCSLERWWRYADAKKLARSFWVGHAATLEGVLTILRDATREEARKLQEPYRAKLATALLGGRHYSSLDDWYNRYGTTIERFLAEPP